MFTLIDRYICRLFLWSFVGATLVLLTLYTAVDATSKMIKYDVSSEVLLRFYLYMAPITIHQFFPVAALIATVFTLSQLRKNNELVAVFSFGMSLLRLSAPLLILISVLSVFSFAAESVILPVLKKKKNYIFYVEMKKTPHQYATVRNNKIWYRSKEHLFYLQTLNTEQKKAQGLKVYSLGSDWKAFQIIVAQRAEVGQKKWQLYDGVVTRFSEESSFPISERFDKKEINLGVSIGDIQATSRPTETLGIREFKEFIEKNKAAGLETVFHEMDYHAKFGFALSAIVLSLLGIPFCVSHHRSGSLVLGFGVCLGLSFTYWSLYSSSIALGRHGEIPPIIAAWGPNLLMAIIGSILFARLKK